MRSFTHKKNTWGVRELARELDQSHTTIFRILETMKAEGFAIQNQETKKYSLGVPFIELGAVVSSQLDLNEVLRPLLEELRDATDESIFLTVVDQNEGRTLLAVESQHPIKFTAYEGSKEPLYAGASYRSILAFQPPKFVEEILSVDFIPYTDKTILDCEVHYAKLTEVRKNGYAISFGEYTPDVVAIAVPVRDASNAVKASLTISGPNYRFLEEQQQRAIPLLMEKQGQLESILEKLSIYF